MRPTPGITNNLNSPVAYWLAPVNNALRIGYSGFRSRRGQAVLSLPVASDYRACCFAVKHRFPPPSPSLQHQLLCFNPACSEELIRTQIILTKSPDPLNLKNLLRFGKDKMLTAQQGKDLNVRWWWRICGYCIDIQSVQSRCNQEGHPNTRHSLGGLFVTCGNNASRIWYSKIRNLSNLSFQSSVITFLFFFGFLPKYSPPSLTSLFPSVCLPHTPAHTCKRKNSFFLFLYWCWQFPLKAILQKRK